jgi:hypothetical protein
MNHLSIVAKYALFGTSSLVRFADDDQVLGVIQLEGNLAEAEKPPEVPKGAYTAEIQDVQIPTSGKGNQYFAVKCVIPPDELPADIRDQFEDGAVLYWNRQLVPTKGDRRAMYNLRKWYEAMGLDPNITEVDPNDWMGQKIKVHVVMGKYQGEDRAEIRSVEAAEAEAPKAPARGKAPAAPARGGRGKR